MANGEWRIAAFQTLLYRISHLRLAICLPEFPERLIMFRFSINHDMPNRIVFFLISCCLTAGSLPAQDTLRLTLEQARTMALDHSDNYRRDLTAPAIQDALRKEAQAQFLPQLSANVDVRYNIQLPTTILPGEVVGRPDEGGIPVQFGTRWNNLISLEVEQPLLDQPAREEIKLIRLNRRLDEINAEITAADLRREATLRYLNVWLSRRQAAEWSANAERQRNTIADIRAGVEGGRLNAIELDRAQTDYAVTLANQNRARQGIELAETRLRSLLDLPEGQPLLLVDSLPDPLPEWRPVSASGIITTLPEYQREALRITLAEGELQQQQQAVLPTVSLYGLAGAQAFGDRLNYFNTRVLPWYSQLYVGLRAKWSINRLFDNQYALERLQLQQKQAGFSLQQQSRELNLAVEEARTALLQAREDLRAQEQRRAFAERERQYVETRFRGDLATAKELIDSERALQVAQQGYLVALANYLLAYYDWQYRIGGL